MIYAVQQVNGGGKVWKTTDGGDSWRKLGGGLPQGIVGKVTVSVSRANPHRVFAMVEAEPGNGLYRSDDGGESWTNVRGDLPDRWVSRVLASRHDEGTAFVTLTGYRDDDFSTYVFRSDDFGGSWRSIAGNLPADSIKSLGAKYSGVKVRHDYPTWGGIEAESEVGAGSTFRLWLPLSAPQAQAADG